MDGPDETVSIGKHDGAMMRLRKQSGRNRNSTGNGRLPTKRVITKSMLRQGERPGILCGKQRKRKVRSLRRS